MKFLRRHKAVLLALGIYWPAIFMLTHIPVPDVARQSGMSDKTMHVLAYFVLSFLVWHAFYPYNRINWKRPGVLLLLAALAVYAALDECLQGLSWVGRTSDVIDFAADMLGVLLAFGLCSLVSFWASLLAVSAIFIFAVSDLSSLLFLYPQYHLNTVFHFSAYTAFALIWMQWLDRYAPVSWRSRRWLLYSFGMPVLLLFIVNAAAPLLDKTIDWIDIATALAGIALAVIVSFLLFGVTRRT